ncbi:MAG TPA: PQQ-binding-like beta-propeller repeat protein [Bryobacteraceae bacterium]|nr:PQQ-binding-like beta-propeller repeat protein [Bryobacteraceae bacterium]
MIRLLPFTLIAMTALAADDDWFRWRGPNNDGMARGDAPTEWSTTKNVAWKLSVPGKGHSSPVVWGNKLFLTTAVPIRPVEAATPEPAGGGRGPRSAGMGHEYSFRLLCIDRNTGKILWDREATKSVPHEGYHSTYGSYASNTPATDGKHVVAFFGSRGVYVYDLDGKQVWNKQFPPMGMRLQFGEGVAPVLDGNSLYLKFDQQKGSYMLALDKNTGKQLWRVERENEESSWSPPLVLTHNGRKMVVVSGDGKTRAYDPADGKVIWEAAGLGGNVIPAPVTMDDIVIVMSGFRNPNLLAIRLGREGDLTGTDAILWTNQRGNSYTPSPVLHEGKLYFLTDSGMLSCFDAKTGKPFYHQQRLPKPYNFKSSPVGVNGKLYLASEEGDVIIVKMGEKFEVLATNPMPDHTFIATPAVVQGSLYLRSQDALYCIRAN